MPRSRGNRGLIGSQQPVTTGSASGIHSILDHFLIKGAGTWPTSLFTVIQTFTATSTWTCPTGVTEVEYLVVAGGGSGAGLTAGGGGGVGGSGGGTTGQSWTGASTNPTGGSQSAGGSGGTGGFGGAGAGGNGGFLSGGSGSNCAGFGGGSGYYGGGGGSGDCGACAGGGGAGGSSYFNTAYFPTALANETGTLRTLGDELSPTTSGGTTDVDYVAGIGSGVAGGAGGNGRVVIIIGSTKYVYSYTSVSPYYYTLTIS